MHASALPKVVAFAFFLPNGFHVLRKDTQLSSSQGALHQRAILLHYLIRKHCYDSSQSVTTPSFYISVKTISEGTKHYKVSLRSAENTDVSLSLVGKVRTAANQTSTLLHAQCNKKEKGSKFLEHSSINLCRQRTPVYRWILKQEIISSSTSQPPQN